MVIESKGRGRALLGGCALAGALLCIMPEARAAAAVPLVVVVSSNPEAPFVRRLAAELSLFGYRVEVATRESNDDDLSEVLARHNGSALIAVDQRRQTAEVIVGEASGPGPFRHERERLDPRRQADTNAAVLAERFRARLTELGIAPGAESAADGELVAEPRRGPSASTRERRLWLAAAFGASGGGFGLMPDAELEIRAFPLRWLSTSAFGRASPFAASVSGREGSADVRLFAAGLLLDAYPLRGKRDDWALRLGLGAMLLDAQMVGHARAPWRGEHDSVLVAAGMFQSAAALRLAPHVFAELRGFVGVCAPSVAVRLGGRRAAELGPFVGATLGVAVGVF